MKVSSLLDQLRRDYADIGATIRILERLDDSKSSGNGRNKFEHAISMLEHNPIAASHDNHDNHKQTTGSPVEIDPKLRKLLREGSIPEAIVAVLQASQQAMTSDDVTAMLRSAGRRLKPTSTPSAFQKLVKRHVIQIVGKTKGILAGDTKRKRSLYTVTAK